VGGTHARAPPAHRAGVGVEELLPREVFDSGGAEALEAVGRRPALPAGELEARQQGTRREGQQERGDDGALTAALVQLG